MGLSKITLFFVLITFSLSTAFNTLVPWDKEVVYDYKALVKAGTHVTASFVSQFVLHGKLHLQANNNATHVKLSDLKYKLYTGVLDHVHEHKAHEMPLPNEVAQLQEIFKIVYDTHGKVIGISTSSKEKGYTRNIKKAIASILQLDINVLKNTEHPHATTTEEHSIYGFSNVLYNVFSHDDTIVVHKMHDMPTTHHMYKHTMTNLEQNICEMPYEEPIIHDSQRKYYIVKKDGHQIVKHIEANGGLFYHPFEGQSEAQYLFVNQTINLLEVNSIEQQFHVVQSEHFDNSLTYHMFNDATTTELPDITNGRRVTDFELYTSLVHKMLEEIWKYMHTDHINVNMPNIEQGQLINRLQRILLYFDLKKLEELHNSLIQKTSEHDLKLLKIFHHILPLVGTKASSLLIKNLVVQKKVSDEVCIELLQHLALHIKMSTTSLITEMEELIHLNENIHWNVRKAAILAFSALIHKNYDWQKRMHAQEVHFSGDDHTKNNIKLHYVQESGDATQLHNLFEKYVIAFVEKIKASTDHKVHLAYLSGLFNMKVDSVLNHLKPALNGEWFPSHHFRLSVLWAISPVIAQYPHEVFEMLWPIFSNHHEHTELRISCYYLILETHPTLSKLMNIFWVLMNEANEEMYNFHYTYMNAMQHSADPCHQDMKLKAAQIMNYMHPPSHGLSFYHIADYIDHKYGFGGGMQGLFINTNDSYILSFTTYSQLYHKYTEDSAYYIKIHGLDHKLGDLFKMATQSNTKMFNIEELLKVFIKIPLNKDIHMEVFWLKNQQIVNNFFFDGSNIKEVALLFDFFVNDQKQTFVKNIIDMSYEKYTKIFMPTDLGFLSNWDYIMPVVTKYDINMAKEVVNKVINVHIDNHYLEWRHYRHGLSFYNSILDVWQGINRYHSVDFVLPMYLDMTLNTQQQSMKLSIKKHQDVHKDIGGMRSHVTSMVFVKDDFQKNLLKQSSPESKEFDYVTNGEQYRQNYLLAHKDDINIGRKWIIQIYDSEHHVSNGSSTHLMTTVFDPSSKSILMTPWSHLLMTYFHWFDYVQYLPKTGTHGLLIRTIPSTDHDVTNIDLSLRINHEIKRDDFVFTPGMKISTRLTYAMKNEGQSLKTWDVNAIVDLNPGHTVNNLKMHLTRIIPGQKDYKVCVEGVKKWTHKGVTGHINMAMSKTEDGKCVKDDTVVDVTMVGERSHEQDHEHHKYGVCQYTIPYFMQHYHTMGCLAAHSSIRKYVYNVKTTNVPTEFKKTVLNFWYALKGYYIAYYNYEEEHNEDIGDNNFKVEMEYPMIGRHVDMHLITPQYLYELSDVPTHFMKWIGVIPDVTLFSSWYINLHSLGWVHHCGIYHDHLLFDHHHVVKQEVGNDWTLYAADAAQNPKHGIYLKNVGDKEIAIKLVEKSHSLEIVPHDGGHQFVLDGQQVPAEEHIHHEDWMTYQVMTHDVSHPVIVTMPHFGVHIECDNHFVQIVLPKTDHTWHGYCFTH